MKTAIIIGAGAIDGLGAAVARTFAANGHHVIVSGHTHEKIQTVAQDIGDKGGSAEAFAADATSATDLEKLMAHGASTGDVDAVIYNAGNNAIIPFESLTAEQFEDFWRICCFGGFLTAKAALPVLKQHVQASLLFTGASGSLRGKPNFAHFAAAKAGLRMLAQSLAREYGPQGIHVAHVVVDGVIDGDRVRSFADGYLKQLGPNGSLLPDEMAKAYWSLHIQHPSAWTHELDVRPFKENW